MNYLVDTHVLIWALKDEPKFSIKPRVHSYQHNPSKKIIHRIINIFVEHY